MGALSGGLFDEIFGDIVVAVGAGAVLLSALLGLVSFRLAVRMKSDSTPRILGRGVVALSSIFGFTLGGVVIGMGFAFRTGFDETIANTGLVITLMMTLLFLTAEFLIAGGLYSRVARDAKSRMALALALLSYALAVAISAIFLLGGLTLVINLASG